MESESKISKDEVKMTQGPTTGSNASVVVCEDAQPVPPSVFKRFLYHLWDNDQHLKSPEERKLVRKLDFGILICATLGWVCIAFSNNWKDLQTNGHA
jgi:ACS family pantothenate transporter-like MFS transporter